MYEAVGVVGYEFSLIEVKQNPDLKRARETERTDFCTTYIVDKSGKICMLDSKGKREVDASGPSCFLDDVAGPPVVESSIQTEPSDRFLRRITNELCEFDAPDEILKRVLGDSPLIRGGVIEDPVSEQNQRETFRLILREHASKSLEPEKADTLSYNAALMADIDTVKSFLGNVTNLVAVKKICSTGL